ncbi:4448_t:CDS:2, partial [Scutellospora calospora]
EFLNFIKKLVPFTKSTDDDSTQSNGVDSKGGLCKPAPNCIVQNFHKTELKKLFERLDESKIFHISNDWTEKLSNFITNDLANAFRSTPEKLEQYGKEVTNIISAISNGTWSRDMHSKAIGDINTNLSLYISDFFDTLHGWSRENVFSQGKHCHRIGSRIKHLNDKNSPYPPQSPWGPETALKGKYAKIYWKVKDLSIKHPLTIDPKNKTLSCVENCEALSGEIYRYFAFIDNYKRALTVKEDGTINLEIYDFTNSAQLWRIENYGMYYALYNKRYKKYFSIQSKNSFIMNDNWSSTAVLLIENRETDTYSIGYTRNNKDIEYPDKVKNLTLVTVPLVTWKNTENKFAGIIDQSNGAIGFSDGEYFENVGVIPRSDQLFLFVPHPDFAGKATIVAHSGKYLRFAPATEGPTIYADNDLKNTQKLAFSLFGYEQNIWPRQVNLYHVSAQYLASRFSQALIAVTKPPVKGTRVRIWKADPSVKKIGVRELHLPNPDITVGPSDSWFDVQANCPPIYPDPHGNFLLEFEDTPSTIPESFSHTRFDAVHCYGVFNLLMSDLEYLDGRIPELNKPWGHKKLTIIPHAGQDANAFYDREDGSLKFFYINQDNEPLYLCRSLDIVAHEAGHAFLDILQDKWLVDGQTGALHEAFGDLTTMFTILSMDDMVELLISSTKSDLRSANNFVAAVGEEFGDLVYKNKGEGIRNLSNDYKG